MADMDTPTFVGKTLKEADGQTGRRTKRITSFWLFMEFCEKLKDIRLKGFESVRWDSVFLRFEYELRYRKLRAGSLFVLKKW